MSCPFGAEPTCTTSISLRAIIFRELVANIIAHREYTNAASATMMIYTDRVEFKNPNVPHYHGRIDPGNFTPFPKNPTICKFMIQLGRYEELGSGVRKVNLYQPHYAPGAGKPLFEDEHGKPAPSLIALKGLDIPAQGNALGSENRTAKALKGRDNSRHAKRSGGETNNRQDAKNAKRLLTAKNAENAKGEQVSLRSLRSLLLHELRD